MSPLKLLSYVHLELLRKAMFSRVIIAKFSACNLTTDFTGAQCDFLDCCVII